MTWWDGFWKPDTTWLATVNTTNLRSVTGVRLSVWLVVAGTIAFAWATSQAVPYCGGDPCKESVGQVRAADFAATIFDTLCLFVGAVMGISVGAYLGKRATDTEHVERKEQAKKAPVVVTTERPAVPQPVHITANDQSTVKVDADPGGTATPRPMEGSEGHPLPAVTELDGSDPKQEWASGDPRSGVL